MTTKMKLIRLKTQVMCRVSPDRLARKMAEYVLTPRQFPLKSWEFQAERTCRRTFFGNGLSAARWGSGDKKVLLVHGWESRATQMYDLARPLVDLGFEVTAIDGPMHGHSNSGQANAVTFAKAIGQAVDTFGPFHSAIGHSLGAVAVSIAMESGVHFDRSVLIATPASMHTTLAGFARLAGLSGTCAQRFIYYVEKEVGRSAKSLDVGRILAQVKPDVLLVHDRADREVAYIAMASILKSFPRARTLTSQYLGHRRIIHSPEIAAQIGDFLIAPTSLHTNALFQAACSYFMPSFFPEGKV